MIMLFSFVFRNGFSQVEINEAWKVKAAPEPTVIPKGKSLAKSVTPFLLSMAMHDRFNCSFNSKMNACAFETVNNLNNGPGCLRVQNKMGSGRIKKVILVRNLFGYDFRMYVVQSKTNLGEIRR